ncbi:hypothetical protein [Paenibacillus sp. KS-LC4]|uniref:hypothetical protein n=1 Tax=Paenibacillus sp. KS-LC4 TaxID=2979727 RepID=UPI0030D18718
MRTVIKMTAVAGFICTILGACSASTTAPLDPAALEAILTTQPTAPSAGVPIKLSAAFTGAELSESSELTFEIRVDDQQSLVEAEKGGSNTFEGVYTFSKSGTYEVYLHLNTEDIHLTKKKQVMVQ